MIERNFFQRRVNEFTEQIGASRESQYGKLIEEFHEVVEARFDPEHLGEELTDLMIVAIGLMDTMGFNVFDMFQAKMDVNHVKYAGIAELKSTGLTHSEAQAVIKARWKNERK